jgi:glutamine---fructose-6-phosphate transaminase (isomerizing)
MAAEMLEQPAVLAALSERRATIVANLRERLPEGLRGIILVARGSSDHAAVWGRYALEAATGLPVSLAAPSLHTLYRVPARCQGYLAVAVSQSGRTPEIVTVLEALRAGGARGVAVTNDPDSPLAAAADVVVALGAGEERAVPATKTFTAQLAAFGFLAEAIGQPPWQPEDWAAVPAAVATVLGDVGAPTAVAARIGSAPGIIVVGRGYLYGVALEAALKLKETTSILAQGYSSADLRHGPIAVVEQDFPVVLLQAHGPAWDDVQDLAQVLRSRGAEVLRVGPDDAELPVPAQLPEPLSAFPSVVRGQQLAHALALHRGLEPDRPEGLRKITATH